MRSRSFLAVLTVLVLGVAVPADARPPTMPDSTRGTKKCGSTTRPGNYRFDVFITRGASRLSCTAAKAVVRKRRPFDVAGWTYWDWTKGGNGPWSDVYVKRGGGAVIGAILQ